MSLIYVADDEKRIRYMIERQLTTDGFEVKTFVNGQELLTDFKNHKADLVITDIMMPEMDGYELCEKLRTYSQVPIIMLSAKDEEMDRVQGLELGSDDYIAKPFSLKELSVKVRNMLRRYSRLQEKVENTLLKCQDLEINTLGRVIHVNDQTLKLTSNEYELLYMLVSNKNQAFSRQDIIKGIYGFEEDEDTRLLDQLIKRIRKKIYVCEGEFEIKTVWGYGYKVGEL